MIRLLKFISKNNTINGLKQGHEIEYKNGTIRTKYHYVNGKRHGEEIGYRYGLVHHKFNWVNGKEHGNFITYGLNGKVYGKVRDGVIYYNFGWSIKVHTLS